MEWFAGSRTRIRLESVPGQKEGMEMARRRGAGAPVQHPATRPYTASMVEGGLVAML